MLFAGSPDNAIKTSVSLTQQNYSKKVQKKGKFRPTLPEIALRSSVTPPTSANFFTYNQCQVNSNVLCIWSKFTSFAQHLYYSFNLYVDVKIRFMLATSACTPERATPRLVCFWFISLNESFVSWLSLLSFS